MCSLGPQVNILPPKPSLPVLPLPSSLTPILPTLAVNSEAPRLNPPCLPLPCASTNLGEAQGCIVWLPRSIDGLPHPPSKYPYPPLWPTLAVYGEAPWLNLPHPPFPSTSTNLREDQGCVACLPKALYGQPQSISNS